MSRLSRRIVREFSSINATLNRALEGWQKFEQSNDDLYVDSVALSIQGVYNGVERLLELIAREVDGTRPQGVNWHQQLLEQMATELVGVRPAVISADSLEKLDEFRRFRHLVRHIYPDEFEFDKISELMSSLMETFTQVSTELTEFAQFLEQQSR